jgi:DNA polymerase III delta subunit
VAVAPQSGARGRQQWFVERLSNAPVRLDAAAATQLDQHLGGDLARLEPLLESLASAYGERAHISIDELAPFLGSAGDATPWALTDAITDGDSAMALEVLTRQLAAGRHPLQLLATLTRHYGALLRLDGAEIHDEAAAAAATGLAPYPARKALEQSRRLGHERIARAIQLLAGADLDLRGRVDWPDELVAEVLVARLAQLSRMGGARPRPARARLQRR